jgi:3-methyladenine DNA glycosylase AlkD
MNPVKLTSLDQVLGRLQALANPEKVIFKAKKFGIQTERSLGIYHKDLKELAKLVEKNDDLALALFDTGIHEARLLCSKLFNPKNITPTLIDHWVAVFDNWEICDSFCMSFIGQSDCAYAKIFELKHQTTEFQKRATFTLMVGYHFGHKKAANSDFEAFIPLIVQAASDERNFVKKAVNWALRTIGKRNVDLQALAITTAQELLRTEHKPAHWIAKNAIRELTAVKVNVLDYPRSIYRPQAF